MSKPERLLLPISELPSDEVKIYSLTLPRHRLLVDYDGLIIRRRVTGTQTTPIEIYLFRDADKAQSFPDKTQMSENVSAVLEAQKSGRRFYNSDSFWPISLDPAGTIKVRIPYRDSQLKNASELAAHLSYWLDRSFSYLPLTRYEYWKRTDPAAFLDADFYKTKLVYSAVATAVVGGTFYALEQWIKSYSLTSKTHGMFAVTFFVGCYILISLGYIDTAQKLHHGDEIKKYLESEDLEFFDSVYEDKQLAWFPKRTFNTYLHTFLVPTILAKFYERTQPPLIRAAK